MQKDPFDGLYCQLEHHPKDCVKDTMICAFTEVSVAMRRVWWAIKGKCTKDGEDHDIKTFVYEWSLRVTLQCQKCGEFFRKR